MRWSIPSTRPKYPESRLLDIGLDSMDMVQLMLKVEAEFDLTLPQPEITPENFQSVKTLEVMMKRLEQRCFLGNRAKPHRQ